MDDANNAAFESVGAVLSRDDSFAHLLDSPEGSAFVLDARTRSFVALADE